MRTRYISANLSLYLAEREREGSLRLIQFKMTNEMTGSGSLIIQMRKERGFYISTLSIEVENDNARRSIHGSEGNEPQNSSLLTYI